MILKRFIAKLAMSCHPLGNLLLSLKGAVLFSLQTPIRVVDGLMKKSIPRTWRSVITERHCDDFFLQVYLYPNCYGDFFFLLLFTKEEGFTQSETVIKLLKNFAVSVFAKNLMYLVCRNAFVLSFYLFQCGKSSLVLYLYLIYVYLNLSCYFLC